MDKPVCQWTSNTDISGIGVRLSFYLQCFLLVILVDRSWQDAPSALWTFIATSFGLTISAITQSLDKQLSFFQALQVMNLVWLANFGVFLALATFSRHRKHERKKREATGAQGKKKRRQRRLPWLLNPSTGSAMKIAATCQTLLSMILTIYAWSNYDDDHVFSILAQWSNATSDSDLTTSRCTPPPVKFYTFFGAHFDVDVGAHSDVDTSGPSIGLAFSSILMAVYLAITAHELYSYIRHRARPKGVSESDVEANAEQTELAQKNPRQDKQLPELPQVVVTEASHPPSVHGHGISHSRGEGSTGASSIGSSYSHSSLNANDRAVHTPVPLSSPPPTPSPTFGNNGRQRRPRRRSQANVDPMFLGIIISSTFLAYFISTTELLIANNPTDQTANQWAFGQILAMVLVVPSFISMAQAFQERGFERIHHRLTKKFTRARHRANLSNGTSE